MTQSGYGVHARQFVKYAMKKKDWENKLKSENKTVNSSLIFHTDFQDMTDYCDLRKLRRDFKLKGKLEVFGRNPISKSDEEALFQQPNTKVSFEHPMVLYQFH